MRPSVFIIGTRAQLVKVAPVLRLAVTSGLPHTVWLAGQHRESIEDLIADFQLQSRIVMSKVGEERSSVGKLLAWIPGAFHECHRYVRGVIAKENCIPLVVVHGDTLSTFVGALAGKMAGGDVVHLESGLSSKHWLDPFPEEMLRRLTFRLTRYALCPNAEASDRMRGYRSCEVVDTGENTLLDCVRYAMARNETSTVVHCNPYFVASIHRFENIYRKSHLSAIMDDIVSVSRLADVRFILHPPTERRLLKLRLWKLLDSTPGIHVEPRMPFTRFLALLAGARGVFTDGGSNQEELSYLGVPTVLFRDRSERSHGLGGNVMLRKNVSGSLVDFVASGRMERIRQVRRFEANLHPSLAAVQALTRWSTCESSRQIA